jgi:hypothetical protein
MPEPTQVVIQHFGAKDSGWDPTRVLWVDVLLLRVNALLRDIKSIMISEYLPAAKMSA